jgi:NAD(P)H-hydrate repair Nnr-like enzyme with NAD(P)H-hydrate epimerase domain
MFRMLVRPIRVLALVLDCLLDYGQQGAPRGETASLIEQSPGRRVLALGVRSGLELETGILHAPHFGRRQP